jgi:hypothetical protein
MDRSHLKVVKGFIVTPIILSVIFSLSLSVFGIFSESEHSKIALFFVGLMGWFIHALPVAFLTILIVGIPGYYLMIKLGYSSFSQYSLSGLCIGLGLPLPLLFLTSSLDWWVWPVTSLFGGIASSVFWYVSVKP